MKLRKITVTALLSLSLMMAGCSLGKSSVAFTTTLGAKDVFKIEDTVCTLPEVKVFLCNYQNIYGSAYGVNLWEHEADMVSLEDYVKEVAISELTRVICMDELAKQEQISLTDEEIVKAGNAAKAYYESLSKVEIDYMGINESTISKLYQDYALAQKVYASLTKGINDEVSDDEARIMEAMQIYTQDSTKAQLAKDSLDSGKDFLSVAADYNEASSIDITFGRGKLPAEVEKAAFELENDEISKLIETADGFYYIKCVDKFKEELTNEHKAEIVKDREKEAFDDVYEQFVTGLTSLLNKELWETVEVELNSDIQTNSFFEMYNEYFGT